VASTAAASAAEGGADDGEAAEATAWVWWRELGGKSTSVDRKHIVTLFLPDTTKQLLYPSSFIYLYFPQNHRPKPTT